MKIALLGIACAACLTIGAGTASAQHGRGGHGGGHGTSAHGGHGGYPSHGGYYGHGHGTSIIVGGSYAPAYVVPPAYGYAYPGYGVGAAYSSGGVIIRGSYGPVYRGGGHGHGHHGHHGYHR